MRKIILLVALTFSMNLFAEQIGNTGMYTTRTSKEQVRVLTKLPSTMVGQLFTPYVVFMDLDLAKKGHKEYQNSSLLNKRFGILQVDRILDGEVNDSDNTISKTDSLPSDSKVESKTGHKVSAVIEG